MNFFTLTSIIIALSALFGYVNARFLKLPKTIGLMVCAIVFTLLLFASKLFGDHILDAARELVASIDFQQILLDVMLGFLLFAGALHTNFDQLRVQRWPILFLSTLGVLSSTFLAGTGSYYALAAIGLDVAYIHCLLFGALISPTDPIAVLGILKQAGVPKKLETKIVGESLFNDGVGVVVFLTIFGIATGGGHPAEHSVAPNGSPPLVQSQEPVGFEEPVGFGEPVGFEELVKSGDRVESVNLGDPNTAELDTQQDNDKSDLPSAANHSPTNRPPADAKPEPLSIPQIAKLFLIEVGGGLLLGGLLGTLTFLLIRSIDDYEIEVMITLATVMGGYSLASALHVSGPLAIVVAGLIVGSDTVRGTSMSKTTETYVDRFWELVDMLMNAVLFVLIGFEILILEVTTQYIYASLLAIVIVLLARFLSLLIPVAIFSRRLNFVPHSLSIMTWGGLRGGISIALALQLTTDMNRDLFVTVTYGVVFFSILVQGLTVGPLAKRLIGSEMMPDKPLEVH